MFYTFRQNNSGGYWVGPVYVCVEAGSLSEAEHRAVESGVVYFDGVSSGRDCDCCGDRWSRTYEWHEDDLTASPTVYGKPLDGQAAGEHYVIVYGDGRKEEHNS